MTHSSKKQSDSKPWCIAPFINFAHEPDGSYQPCCEGTPQKDNNITTYDVSPAEYFTGNNLNRIRREFLANEISANTEKICMSCISKEKKGVISAREQYNTDFYNGSYEKYETKALQDNLLKKYNDPMYSGSIEDLAWVNFKTLGNLCNLKCVTCDPLHSSKIAAEVKMHDYVYELAGANGPAEKIPFTGTNKKQYLDDFKLILEHISKFQFVGGEPFLNPDFLSVWDMCVKSKNAKNLRIQVTTNGTILPQAFLDYADKVQDARILFSIDGVADRGSYVRSSLNWQDFDDNVKRASNTNTVDINFIVLISILNIGYLDDIMKYCLQFRNFIHLRNFITFPSGLRAVNLPWHIKEFYLDKLMTFLAEYKDVASEQNNFSAVIDVLKNKNIDHTEFLMGIKHLKRLDEIRNTNLLVYFPEFTEYYNEI